MYLREPTFRQQHPFFKTVRANCYVLAASYFAAVWLGAKTKLEILAMHVMDAAKRIFGIPDFRYYALADGISAVFKRVGKGPLCAEIQPVCLNLQLPLFDP